MPVFSIFLYARNSKQMQIPEGLSVPGATHCANVRWTVTPFSVTRFLYAGRDCDAAKALSITTYMSVPVHRGWFLYSTLCATSTEKKLLSERGEHVLKLCRADCPVYSERVVAFNFEKRMQRHRLLLYRRSSPVYPQLPRHL